MARALTPRTIELIGTVQDQLNALKTQVAALTDENRRLRGATNNRKKLTRREVERIRGLAGTMSQREIAYAFDINPATVSRLIRGIYHRTTR
ncbi:helix-turn-helix domain-containing protein [Amycolatopsis cihanbeyliensis]|uniref:Helix-turn-helix protein n=1 Tax=Amycolatopsis cihanbeyliensis TaxID=1128664 RepID=A0A542DNM7_AMYCI|nr:helix-turn-helix domain-containing protein [Amycolatopsis cihanbeyliensis]TQJ04657.1 hypothetical protein FB471_4460 [Amycolatopsis cihanbeyliensis]